jgi:hypothetical protein
MKRFLLLIVILLPSLLIGQKADVDFGFMGAISLYSGDLSPKEFGIYLKDIGISGGVFIRNRYSRALAFRTGLSYISIKGNERNGGNLQRGLAFRNNMIELSGVAELSLFHFGYDRSKTTFGPYLVAGLAAIYSDPHYASNGGWVQARSLGTEGQGLAGYHARYSPIQFSTPFGIGLQVIIRDRWTIGYEVVMRRALGDYLDDVSNNTVKFGDVVKGNGALAAQFSNPVLENKPENYGTTYVRGGRFVDYYYLSSLTVAFRIVNVGRSKSRYMEKNACPRFY